jgi:phage terminase large subunit
VPTEGKATPTGYVARPQQAELHAAMKRFNVIVCHRRFGKTVLAINETISRALLCKADKPRFAYIAPFYRQAKQVAWDYMKKYTAEFPDAEARETELRIDFAGGCRIQLFGADNPDALRGMYFDGVVFDEYAMMPRRAWTEVIRPALADRGGWAVFIGTPRGRNALFEIYEQARKRMEENPAGEWFAALRPASATGILPEAELASARSEMSPAEYDQEFECSFHAALPGAYYAGPLDDASREGRIGRAPWQPDFPVHTAWDLGIGDATAIWFVQQAGSEIHWIDYYEADGHGLDHYARVLRDRPYVYGEHLVPHDAAARELGTGRSRIETLARLGLRARLVPRHGVEDGINALRLLLPRSWFDEARCARGIEALRSYRREWDDRRQVFSDRPLHDWSSHAADAARTAAMGLRSPRDRARMPASAESEYDVFAN